MRIRTIKVCLKDGCKGILRNGLMSLASIGTIAACLFILGLTFCIVRNVQQFTNDLGNSLGIVVFLQEGVTEEQGKSLAEELNARDEVKGARYISPDEAWLSFKQTLEKETGLNSDILSELDQDNPLANCANIEVYLYDAQSQESFVEYLETSSAVRSVKYSNEAADMLSSFSKLVTYVGLALIAILIFIAVLLIVNTIKLSVYIRRYEINIMKYIGARDSFVKLPSIVEGVIIGLIGAVVPGCLIYFAYYYVVEIINERFSSVSYLFNFLSVNAIMQTLIPLFLILGVLVGIIGSSISIRKHLKV